MVPVATDWTTYVEPWYSNQIPEQRSTGKSPLEIKDGTKSVKSRHCM